MTFPIPLQQVFDCAGSIGDSVVKFQRSSSGFLSTSIGKIGKSFTEISKEGNCPLNRCGFGFCQINNKEILITGGVGKGILEFEVWKFNLENKKWNQLTNKGEPIKRRKNHKSILFELNGISYIYNICGSGTLSFRNDILMFEFGDDYFIPHILPIMNKNFVPRTNYSITSFNNKYYLFGGIDKDGFALNDFWVFTIGKTHLDVKLKQITSESPPPRHSHIMWVENDRIRIAGGFNSNQKLQDIWEYLQTWHQKAMFRVDTPYFIVDNKLCYIDQTVTVAETYSPFKMLDGVFEELQQKQKILKESKIKLEETIKTTAAEEAKLSPIINDSKKCAALFTEGGEKELRLKADKLHKEAPSKLSSIYKPVKVSEPYSQSALAIDEYMSANLQNLEIKQAKDVKQHNLEIRLISEQIEALKSRCPKPLEMPDLADHESFMAAVSGLPEENRAAAIEARLGRLQIEYGALKTRATAQSVDKLAEERLRSIGCLVEDARLAAEAAEAEARDWAGRVAELEGDFELAKKFAASCGQRAVDKAFAKECSDRREELAGAVRALGNGDAVSGLIRESGELQERAAHLDDVRGDSAALIASVISLANQILK